jgi:hypothetical protein
MVHGWVYQDPEQAEADELSRKLSQFKTVRHWTENT